jgi:hypothetical protein
MPTYILKPSLNECASYTHAKALGRSFIASILMSSATMQIDPKTNRRGWDERRTGEWIGESKAESRMRRCVPGPSYFRGCTLSSQITDSACPHYSPSTFDVNRRNLEQQHGDFPDPVRDRAHAPTVILSFQGNDRELLCAAPDTLPVVLILISALRTGWMEDKLGAMRSISGNSNSTNYIGLGHATGNPHQRLHIRTANCVIPQRRQQDR